MSENQASTAKGLPMVLKTENSPCCPEIPEFVSNNLPEPQYLDLKNYQNRLSTFNDWRLEYITPQQMAHAGLYYLGRQDSVRCAFCSKNFDYWLPHQDPYAEHMEKSPECPFFKETPSRDVCGTFDFSLTKQTVEETEIFLNAVPVHKEMVKLEDRLKTFERCQIKLKQDIYTLCDAGFFYLGNGQDDQMYCFCCNQGLNEWEDNDEPWTEHARWSKDCTYLLFRKGNSFVEECGKKIEIPQNNQEEIPSMENIKVDFSKSKSTEQNLQSILGSKNGEAEKSENLLCKICQVQDREVVFIPCGHVIACLQCSMQLNNCAICRKSFYKIMRVYL